MTEFKLWLAFFFIGMLVAAVAFLMILGEDFFISVKGEVFQYLTISGSSFGNIGFFILFSVVMASSAAMLTVYVAPKAAGSGIPEMIGCLNGVKVT